ncbi:hypothetical protein FO504_30335, partial [Bacillus cereus]|nr:hypothetical protein [Bacillus cereus]
IVIATMIKQDEIEWIFISLSAVATAAFLYLISLLFPQGRKKSKTKKEVIDSTNSSYCLIRLI